MVVLLPMRANDLWWVSPWLLALAIGCEAKVDRSAAASQAAQAANAPESPKPQSAGEDAAEGAAEAPSQPAEDPRPEEQGEEQGEAAGPKDLGQRFRDPPWFRKTMFEGATAVDTARSELDEQGLFKSHILFELPEGTTAEQCVEQVLAKVSPTVPNLERGEPQADGRLTVQGSTDRYKVMAICGEAKGKTMAYVAYEWTSP